MGFYGDQKIVDPKEMDPLYSKSGAAPLREGIFNMLPGIGSRAVAGAQNAADAARRGAAMFNPVMQFGQNVLSGQFLRSNPALDRSMASTRAASSLTAKNTADTARANLAAQQAATRAQFGRSGQTFGTTNQLAQEGTAAAMESQIAKSEADRNAQLAANENQARAANYAQERGFQQQAPGIVAAAASKPLEMLQAVPGLMYSGIEPAVNIIRGLASGAPPALNPTNYYKPGAGDYTLQGLGALGAAGAGGF